MSKSESPFDNHDVVVTDRKGYPRAMKGMRVTRPWEEVAREMWPGVKKILGSPPALLISVYFRASCRRMA